MREIKFRIWSSREMKYDELYITLDGRLEFDGKDCSSMPIMQYTGLEDRNGTEIYEGDIVAYWQGDVREEYLSHKLVRPIEWIATTQKTGWNIARGRGDVMNWEIIGNVWENPELLKERK